MSTLRSDDLNIDIKIGIVAGSNLPMFINVTHGTAANRVNRKGLRGGRLHRHGG
jgi:hypothetical protein